MKEIIREKNEFQNEVLGPGALRSEYRLNKKLNKTANTNSAVDERFL